MSNGRRSLRFILIILCAYYPILLLHKRVKLAHETADRSRKINQSNYLHLNDLLALADFTGSL